MNTCRMRKAVIYSSQHRASSR